MSSREDASPSRQDNDDSVTKTIAKLERLSEAAVRAMSLRDWDFTKTAEAKELLEHISPDWSAQFDNYADPLSFADQVLAHRKFMEQNQTAYYEIQSIFTDIVPGADHASVFLQIDIRQIGNTTIHGFSEFKWQLIDCEWIWYHHIATRGMLCI